jgi:ferritin
MISKKMTKALNQQIVLEGYASFLYLSMATWCGNEGLDGCEKFMQRQSEEERMHMLKIFEYMNEVDAMALTPAIAQVPHQFETPQKMFNMVYEHEQKVTKSIHGLLKIAKTESDYTTENFLQWYIAEQREEENLMRSILDKIKLIGKSPMALYYIDKEIDAVNTAEEKAEGGA